MDEIRARLEVLNKLPTVPQFSRLFCELIAARLERHGRESRPLRDAFAAFLEREARYHLQLGNLQAPGDVIPKVSDIVGLAEKRRIGLQDTREALAKLALAAGDDELEATRNLVVAECCYHLALHDVVVASLERAVRLGAQEPLVHFALGYNRYVLAHQGFCAMEALTGKRVVVDQLNFRIALLDAVSAFEAGLTGGPLDPFLNHWIGVCLRQAGFEEASRHTSSRGEVEEDVESPEPREGEAQAHQLSQISLGEIREVRRLLSGSFSISDLLEPEDPLP